MKASRKADFAEVVDRLQAVGIVEAEDGGLGGNVGGSEAGGVLRIAFDFGGAKFVGLDEDGIGNAADGKSGGVEERFAGDQLFRRFHVRHHVLGGLFGAGTESGQGERRAHNLQEVAPAFVVEPFAGLTGEFSVEKILEAFGCRQLIQTAPEGRAFGFRQCGLDGLQTQRIALCAH